MLPAKFKSHPEVFDQDALYRCRHPQEDQDTDPKMRGMPSVEGEELIGRQPADFTWLIGVSLLISRCMFTCIFLHFLAGITIINISILICSSQGRSNGRLARIHTSPEMALGPSSTDDTIGANSKGGAVMRHAARRNRVRWWDVQNTSLGCFNPSVHFRTWSFVNSHFRLH